MKLGAFVLGGLAGAAVVWMMRNRSVAAVADGFGQKMKQRVSQAKATAIDKGLSVNFGGGLFGSSFKGDMDESRGDAQSDGLEEAKLIASQDPKVMRDINEILHENGQKEM